MTTRRPLVAGNWKMNGVRNSAVEVEKLIEASAGLASKLDLMVCPPATLMMSFAALAKGSKLLIGGQDCHPEPSGPCTGDISAEMLADAGATAVIVGHSERRTCYIEDDTIIRRKALAAWRAGLTAIVCIGETEGERQARRTLDVIGRQLGGSLPDGVSGANLVVAYEPVWAIGTGRTPTRADVVEVHAFIRERLNTRFGSAGEGVRVLYGGSVKPANAKELLRLENVDGALVGGASLKADDFLGIAAAYV